MPTPDWRDRKRTALLYAAKASPWVAASATFGALWQYSPALLFTLPASQYAVSTFAASTVGALVWITRASASKTPREDAQTSASPIPLRSALAALRTAAVQIQQPPGIAWCTYLNATTTAQVPSAPSTAYALRAALIGALSAPDWDIEGSIDWIQSKANPDGGWSVQSQGGHSRPEVTAIVAGTIARLKSKTAVAAAVGSIEASIDQDQDTALRTYTSVVATILDEGPFIGLSRHHTGHLVHRLVDGAITNGDETYWTEDLIDPRSAKASLGATARAVMALGSQINAGRHLSAMGDSVLRGGTTWLLRQHHLADSLSVITRFINGRQEVHNLRHFNAALVVLALTRSGVAVTEPAIGLALERVMGSFHDGRWWLESGEAPVWMTYFGLAALDAATPRG